MITGSEAESRALMMNAAVRVVAKHGFEGFTTKKWAQEAGVAEGSLYYHFKSKNDLLDETFFMISQEIAQLYLEQDSIPAEGDRIQSFIEELWVRGYRFLLANPDKTLYYFRFRTSLRFTNEIQQELLNRYATGFMVFNLLEEQLKMRNAADLNVVWSFVFDSTVGFAFRVLTGGFAHTEKTEAAAASLVMRGLAGLIV